MDERLKEAAEGLARKTIDIIECVEKDDFGHLDNLLEVRQQAIDALEKFNCSKEDYTAANEKYNILELNNKLQETINNKRLELKNKIEEVSKNKVATNSYNNLPSQANIFSKKI